MDGGSCCGIPGGFSFLLPVHSSALGLVQWEVVVAAPSWIQEQGSACGLAGALACCSAPGRCWGWSHQDCVGGLSRCYLHSTAPGQVYAGDLAAALALPPAQEAAACSGAGLLTEPCGRILQQGMLFTAWCLWHGASTTVVTAMSLLLPSLLPQPLPACHTPRVGGSRCSGHPTDSIPCLAACWLPSHRAVG